MPAIRLHTLSATYRAPLDPRPPPVGPMTRAFGAVLAGKPEPICLLDSTRGVLYGVLVMTSRCTVPPLAFGCLARMPPRTLVTNRSAVFPYWAAVMSHGPSMPYPEMVFLTCPHWSRTIRQPGPEIAPLTVGSEPTTTQPLGSATRAVVRPTPPGHAASLILANRLALPRGETCTMVVPVPWTLAELLKLLTSTSPPCRSPVLPGTTATP